LEKNSQNKITKAGALLCPFCCVEYEEVVFNLAIDREVLRNVKALKCPLCEEEVFSPEQIEAVLRELADNFSISSLIQKSSF
jgi:hypothetical protein